EGRGASGVGEAVAAGARSVGGGSGSPSRGSATATTSTPPFSVVVTLRSTVRKPSAVTTTACSPGSTRVATPAARSKAFPSSVALAESLAGPSTRTRTDGTRASSALSRFFPSAWDSLKTGDAEGGRVSPAHGRRGQALPGQELRGRDRRVPGRLQVAAEGEPARRHLALLQGAVQLPEGHRRARDRPRQARRHHERRRQEGGR